MSKKYTSAHISNADKVLDAVTEVRKEEAKPAFACFKCGSHGYTPRKALGGPLLMICTTCGHKNIKGRGNLAPLVAEAQPHKQGSSRGPTYSNKPKPKQDKHQHKFRSKGVAKK